MTVWDRLIGQDEAVETLKAAARAGQDIAAGRPAAGRAAAAAGALAHAWLFTGPPGSGRSVAARALAAALQCTAYASEGAAMDAPGCGECSGCHTALGGTHPDVHVVNPEGLSIGVDETRAVVGAAARRPALGGWQVMIIEDADRLTEQASNALLKAVEEPPARTIFLLCAPSLHPDDVSVTIRSRCRSIVLRTPPTSAIEGVLRDDGVPAEDAHWLAQAAQGHVGRARWLARDPDARERRAAVLSIPASLTSMERCFVAADHLLAVADAESGSLTTGRDAAETEALKTALGAGGTGRGAPAVARGTAGAVKDLERRQKARATRTKRDVLDGALIELAGFYRDVLLRQARAPSDPAHPDAAAQVAAVADAVTPVGALNRLEAVLACREAIELNVKPRIAVEAMTVALRLSGA